MASILLVMVLNASAAQLVPGIPGTSLSLGERWQRLEATTRLHSTTGYGTAVVVGRRDDDLYLLTAEHVVRKGSDLTLELYDRGIYPKVARTVKFGSVIEEFANPDFAVLKFPVDKKQDFPMVRIAQASERPKRFPVGGLSIGCTNGMIPICEDVTITAKRLARRANDEEIAFFWETAQIPVSGRSGGPLFDGAGNLIGICSATTGGKGFYTHLDEILVGLKQRKLDWLVADHSPDMPKKR